LCEKVTFFLGKSVSWKAGGIIYQGNQGKEQEGGELMKEGDERSQIDGTSLIKFYL